MTEPKDFSDMFDKDGEVIVTEQGATTNSNPPKPGPDPLDPTHRITNTQAGAEFNVFFKNDAGFKGHLKLHGVSGRDVLETAAGALAYLSANNFTPEHSTAVAAAQVTREDLPQDGTASQTTCPIHHVPMERRENENGVWYSHKTTDPAYEDKKGYCNGKPRS